MTTGKGGSYHLAGQAADRRDPVIDGRLCQQLGANITCCLPCPITDWVYPDAFNTLSEVADWASVVGALCCVSLLLSYAFLPVESTNRHYLSISIVIAVILMNVSFTLSSFSS